jgi:hypothetical protein
MVIRPAIAGCRLADNKVRKKTKRERENTREIGRKKKETTKIDYLHAFIEKIYMPSSRKNR